MEDAERKHYESPKSADELRGRFATHFFGLNIGEAAPKGKLPRNVRVESSAEGLVRAVCYELWNRPQGTFEVLSSELSSRFGASSPGPDGGRDVSWAAQGIRVQLQERMLDPGPKLTLHVTEAPVSSVADEDIEHLTQQLRHTFSELDNVSVTRKDPQTLAITADLRGDDFAGVIVNWKGPATIDGALQPALVDRVLEELQDAQAQEDDFEM